MNWIAFPNFAVERALVDYVREATIPGLQADHIYAGLSHGSADNPEDLASIDNEAAWENAVNGQIEAENISHNDETLKIPKVVITCTECEPADGFPNGNAMIANVLIELTGHSDDARASEYADMAGRLFDIFCDPHFADLCSAMIDGFGINGRDIGKSGYRIDGHQWVIYREMKMECAATGI